MNQLLTESFRSQPGWQAAKSRCAGIGHQQIKTSRGRVMSSDIFRNLVAPASDRARRNPIGASIRFHANMPEIGCYLGVSAR
jgi:hypothetical protein